ncbi:hypothetical protein NHQ30_005348 [Ciborinia camelliae]|nr:hypothetical protein NHQ30_005348 [Ciborinia camelliae]
MSDSYESQNKSPTAMDNSGRGPLIVPGFGTLPIEYELPLSSRFAHGVKEWEQVPAVTARELAMVALMNNLTDKPDWQVGVFDSATIARWREENYMNYLMSEKAWDWCVKELRDKAMEFNEKGFVKALDTGSCICKSDVLVPESLGAEIRDDIAVSLERGDRDWQPKSNEQVLNLVDPSLFPLVYGKSPVLADGGQVDLDNVLGPHPQATVAPRCFDRRVDSAKVQAQVQRYDENGCSHILSLSVDRYRSDLRYYHWSSNFQWLPCEVEFTKESGTDVHITSYINNLHPTNTLLYKSIEKLISLSIKPWNDCLIEARQEWKDDFNQEQRGRVPLRIITYGIEWENELPEWALAFNLVPEGRVKAYFKYQEVLKSTPDGTEKDRENRTFAQKRLEGMRYLEDRINMPKPTPELWKMAKEYLELPVRGPVTPLRSGIMSGNTIEPPEEWAKDEQTAFRHIIHKHEQLMTWNHPEPGTAFSYEDWKSGNNNKAIVEMVMKRPDRPHFLPTSPDHKPYTVALEDKFRKQGLQVIVKVDGIELTPDKPKYTDGFWQLEGQMNEHIVATAIYTYSVSNVTGIRISFRQETQVEDMYYQYATYRYDKYDRTNLPAHRYGKDMNEIDILEEILGFENGNLAYDRCNILPFQNIGSVILPQGRLITFPHTVEYCIEPFELADPNNPGHYKSITLYLVDPNYRVCSTRNVPPQQHSWWNEAMSDEFLKLGVPREIAAEIASKTDHDGRLMTLEEAKEYRLEMMKEHRWMDMARYSGMHHYAFE